MFNFKSGFTLIELLTVLAIIAMLSGIGMAFISTANKQFDLQATRGVIISLLRFAKSQAIKDKSGTEVVFDLKSKDIYLLLRKNIRLWHMEDNTNGKSTGAYQFNAEIPPEVSINQEGRYGRALEFNGSGEVDCGALSLKGNEKALIFDVWVYPISASDQTIINMKDDRYFLRFTKDQGLLCKFGDIQAGSLSDVVPLNKWSRVQIVYDGNIPNLYTPQWAGLKVYLNGSVVAEINGTSQADTFDQITVSLNEMPFLGKIDEFKIDATMEVDRNKLEPKNVNITSNLTPVDDKIKIPFDSKGNMSLGSSAEVTLSSPSNKENFTITINSHGMVDVK